MMFFTKLFNRVVGQREPSKNEMREVLRSTAVAVARATTLQDLEPLFLKAEGEGLWFYNRYANQWFSPKRLRSEHRRNRFIWGPKHWELRQPLKP